MFVLYLIAVPDKPWLVRFVAKTLADLADAIAAQPAGEEGIICAHRDGTAFVLPDDDQERLAALLAGSHVVEPVEVRGMRYYRADRRRPRRSLG